MQEAIVVSVAEAAHLLGVGHQAIRRWIRTGRLGATQIGGRNGRILITKAAIERLLDIGGGGHAR